MIKIEHLSSYPAAVKTTIKYTNDEEQENFGINQNRFDYKHIKWTVLINPSYFIVMLNSKR
ncbi:hypothetical protein NW062_02635 [Mycoplasmopsis cynos]|nr:hypothetical protein NW062_02635 [Mycoplasmopsis cynos]